MSGLFGGSSQKTTSKVEIDPEMRREASSLLDVGRLVASLGYNPQQGPTIAAFTPMQEAAFANTNAAASAFGMQGGANPLTGVNTQTSASGIRGYSGYEDFMREKSNLPPEVLQQINDVFAALRSGPQQPAPSFSQNGGSAFSRSDEDQDDLAAMLRTYRASARD